MEDLFGLCQAQRVYGRIFSGEMDGVVRGRRGRRDRSVDGVT